MFGTVSAAELFQKFEIKDDAGVILLKKFDEGRNTLEGNGPLTLLDFECILNKLIERYTSIEENPGSIKSSSILHR